MIDNIEFIKLVCFYSGSNFMFIIWSGVVNPICHILGASLAPLQKIGTCLESKSVL